MSQAHTNKEVPAFIDIYNMVEEGDFVASKKIPKKKAAQKEKAAAHSMMMQCTNNSVNKDCISMKKEIEKHLAA